MSYWCLVTVCDLMTLKQCFVVERAYIVQDIPLSQSTRREG